MGAPLPPPPAPPPPVRSSLLSARSVRELLRGPSSASDKGRLFPVTSQRTVRKATAKIRDETQERAAGETLKALGSNTSVAEMEISINNRKSVALLRKHGQSAIEAAQPEVRKWGSLRAQDYCGRLAE